MPRTAEVWGSPIGHSLSPVLHRAAYAALGVDWTYGAREVDQVSFPRVWGEAGHRLSGVSLTMPLKEQAAQAAARRSDVVDVLGVANTLARDADGRWCAHNTDATALRRLLAPAGPAGVLVVGGGASAASALWALAGVGAREVTVATRSGTRPTLRRAAARLGLRVTDQGWDQAPGVVRTLVLTVPADARDDYLTRHGARLGEGGFCLDLAYAGGDAASDRLTGRGWRVVSGLDVLAEQAADQVRLMTGRAVDAAVLRAAVAP